MPLGPHQLFRFTEPFELQTLLNNLAEKFSESIVKHAFVNLRIDYEGGKEIEGAGREPE